MKVSVEVEVPELEPIALSKAVEVAASGAIRDVAKARIEKMESFLQIDPAWVQQKFKEALMAILAEQAAKAAAAYQVRVDIESITPKG